MEKLAHFLDAAMSIYIFTYGNFISHCFSICFPSSRNLVSSFDNRYSSPLILQFWDLSLLKHAFTRTSLMVQGLRLCGSDARSVGLISSQETKISQTTRCSQKKKKKMVLLISVEF